MKRITLLFSLFFLMHTVSANPGDTTHVVSHNAVTVVTNPGTGWNPYPAWAVFPAASVKYRKILLNLKYKCPSGMACGEWDYLDYVIVRRKGGVNDSSLNMEIARFITPYGNGFSSTFAADWTLDLTDYAMLLHDSVEIEYQHTGYETNTRGWSVTVDFALIEGTPVMEPVKISQVWNGSFPFGNASNSIENYLTPHTFVTDTATQLSRLRMLQTGHGSDSQYCSEFCIMNRYLYFDSVLTDTKAIWRTCGKNALYPQGGTWVYDRGNWCPGATVFPDIYDFTTAGGSTHVVNADMTPYTNSSPSANYMFGSQIIEYKLPQFTNDAAIDNVYAPNSTFEFIRMNPVCHDPSVSIKNNSLTPLTSAVIKYGLSGQTLFTFNWTGNLAFADTARILLPGITVPASSSDKFEVYLASVNGTTDDYPLDDTMRVSVAVPAAYDPVFFLSYKTNNNPWENDLKVEDASGTVVFQLIGNNLNANTTYKDTLFLAQNSCYRLIMTDNGGDGLSWWANSAQGTGLLRFQRLNNTIMKNFGTDFGSEIYFEFMTNATSGVGMEENENLYSLDVFPNPAQGIFQLQMKLRQAAKVELKVYSAVGELVYADSRKVETPDFKTEMDLSKLPSGFYYVTVQSGGTSVSRKIEIIR